MAGRLLALGARSLKPRAIHAGACGAHGDAHDPVKQLIGNREVVGFGFNGQPNYMDRSDFPMPAIRWQETTASIQTLREKEKGDWRQLSFEEKRALYRASFRQTFTEFKAPTGEWKSIVGCTLMLVSAGLLVYMAIGTLTHVPLPESYSEERQKAQLRRMLDTQTNPVEGISSKWDYEKNDWKK